MNRLSIAAIAALSLALFASVAFTARPTPVRAGEPSEPAAFEFDPIGVMESIARLATRLDAVEARLTEVEASPCRCEPSPAPMPAAPTAEANGPTHPAPNDGRHWTWEMGSHGRMCWVTRGVAVPARSSVQPSYQPAPAYQPAYRPAYQPAPAWGGGGCANGNCYRR